MSLTTISSDSYLNIISNGVIFSDKNVPAALICSLLLQIKKDPKVKNVLHYNNLIECLDLHLIEIDLIDY